jgi:quercetin dioxygenase-like cupin family protein
METLKTPPVTLEPGEGQNVSVVGDSYRILISGNQTNTEFATIDMLIPPDGGPGPHAHADFQESFYVIEGEIEFSSEVSRYTADKGSFVVIPKGGIVHSFKNKTNKTAHLLCTVVPSGLEEFFLEIGKPVDEGEFLPPVLDKDSIDKMKIIAKKYGQEIYPSDYLEQLLLQPV